MIKQKTFRPFIFLFFFCSCNPGGVQEKNQVNDSIPVSEDLRPSTFKFDLSHPQKKWALPPELTEISGNTWIDKEHLLVIEDINPDLYLLRLGNPAVIEKTIPFKEDKGKKFDVEDIAIANGIVYTLWSHGAVFKIKDWNAKPQVEKIETNFSKKNNTEGLCFDPVSQNLLIACKNESDVEDEKKSTRAVYEFDVKTDKVKEEPFLLIHKKDFTRFAGQKIEFFPSAIAVHPITHDIYILSTKDNKCMAQYSHNGELKAFQFIEKDLLQQPEGMCFAPNGTLFISTEGKHGEPAYVYQFGPAK
jgi:hypothetical protein